MKCDTVPAHFRGSIRFRETSRSQHRNATISIPVNFFSVPDTCYQNRIIQEREDHPVFTDPVLPEAGESPLELRQGIGIFRKLLLDLIKDPVCFSDVKLREIPYNRLFESDFKGLGWIEQRTSDPQVTGSLYLISTTRVDAWNSLLESRTK